MLRTQPRTQLFQWGAQSNENSNHGGGKGEPIQVGLKRTAMQKTKGGRKGQKHKEACASS